jgi:hypothetical protein
MRLSGGGGIDVGYNRTYQQFKPIKNKDDYTPIIKKRVIRASPHSKITPIDWGLLSDMGFADEKELNVFGSAYVINISDKAKKLYEDELGYSPTFAK